VSDLEPTVPIPSIKEINNYGLVRVFWNVEMLIPANISALTVSESFTGTIPLVLRIIAGSKEKDPFNLIITNYSIKNFSDREMLI
jgi:hypothetical protein